MFEAPKCVIFRGYFRLRLCRYVCVCVCVSAWQKYHLSLKFHYKTRIFHVARVKAEKVHRKTYADLQSLTRKSV